MITRYELEPFYRNTPSDDFLTDLKKVAGELKSETVSMSQYTKLGIFHASTVKRHFGSWNKALRRAGLATVNMNVTEEELFDNLVKQWARLGRQPRFTDLTSQTSSISADTYKRRFGGWRKALEAFVLWANQNPDGTVPVSNARTLTKRQTNRNINYRLRFLVMRNDNFRCRITGRSPANDPSVILEVDHIVPWEKGGETVFENLQTLAKDVNIGKSNLDMQHDE